MRALDYRYRIESWEDLFRIMLHFVQPDVIFNPEASSEMKVERKM